jgi:stage II sporulation protein D
LSEVTKRFNRAALVLVFVFLCANTSAAQLYPAGTSHVPFFVRVLVAENRTFIRLTVKKKYLIRLLPSMQIVKTGDKLIGERLLPTSKGFRLGQQEWEASGLVIEPAEDRDLYLDDTRFRGNATIYKQPNGLMFAVNRLDIEGYLYGVLHHEVAHWWPMEALKAQAIAARTYATYQTQVSQANLYDLKSSTSSQMYGGSTTERSRTKKAVDRTKGQVLTYEGKIFPAYFHATCAGTTAGAQELWKIRLPPISGGVKCSYCRLSPHFYWQAKVPLSTIEAKLKENNRPLGQILKIEPISKTPSGRVGSLKITGTTQETVIAAKDFRIWVGGDLMKSTNFTVEIKDDVAEFEGKGWGHGVGLCQWGALGQALSGRSCRDILKFYYPGSVISQ